MTDPDLEIPDDADEESWVAGYAAAMQAVAETAQAHADLVGAVDGRDDQDDDEDVALEDLEEGDDCPNCGHRLVKGIGSKVPICLNCDINDS